MRLLQKAVTQDAGCVVRNQEGAEDGQVFPFLGWTKTCRHK